MIYPVVRELAGDGMPVATACRVLEANNYCPCNRLVSRRSIEPGQYLAIRYTERLAEAGVVASVGSKGDSYDNAMAEAFNSLFKAETFATAAPGRTSTTLTGSVSRFV